MAAVSSTTVVQSDGSRRQRVDPGLLTLLADYDIHQSPQQATDNLPRTEIAGQIRPTQPSEFDPTLAAHPPVARAVSNPEWWDATYRRVPPYRPVNRELDMEERRQNPVFQAVGVVMIFGCMTIAVSATCKRFCGRKLICGVVDWVGLEEHRWEVH